MLVATPVKNAKDHIEKYFGNLAAMTYPKCAPKCAVLTALALIAVYRPHISSEYKDCQHPKQGGNADDSNTSPRTHTKLCAGTSLSLAPKVRDSPHNSRAAH